MNKVVLSLGSNSQDCNNRMSECITWLNDMLVNVKLSHIYSTPAVNGIDNNYLNAVAFGEIDSSFEELNVNLKQYEKENGRTPDCKIKGVIPIDLDIVIWNDKIIRENDYNQSYFQIGWKNINSK